MPDGILQPLTRHQPGSELEDGHKGAGKTIQFIARQWASPSVKENVHLESTTVASEIRKHPATTAEGTEDGTLQLVKKESKTTEQAVDLDLFLDRLKTHMFSISCMAFQDAWNVDLERIRDCCIHVLSPDGGLIPFCMYNLTDVQGKSLYRKQ